MKKRILLAVTGSIAAYKSAELIRLLKEENYDVRVVMTESAQAFITPMTLAVLSEHPVYTDTFDQTAPMIHIELARFAELVIIAPASADTLARLAYGHANDLLTTLCLATSAPIFIAPAMNQKMWQHPATQKNIQQLTKYQVTFLPTGFGTQACGDVGFGRMLEPCAITQHINNFFQEKTLTGVRVLITAGPTQEAIDPVRFLSNHSSGKMGYALAKCFQEAGADVILISGPTSLCPPKVTQLIQVTTAEAMYDAVMAEVHASQLFIATAAVADFTCCHIAPQKIKKSTNTTPTLTLTPTKDILQTVGMLNPRPFIVGFAAETENLLKNAEEKLIKKQCDLLVANLVQQDIPFHADDNQVFLLEKNKPAIEFPHMSKQLLAQKLCQFIAASYAHSEDER